MEQLHKTNPIIQEPFFFLFQLQHLSLPFVEYFPDLLQTFHTLAFRVSVSAPNPYLFVHFFLLCFAHTVSTFNLIENDLPVT